MRDHDAFCPCNRFQAALDFCNCEVGRYGNGPGNPPAPPTLVKQFKSAKSRWKRKKGIDRRPGHRRLNDYRPVKVHKFGSTRVNDIEALLVELELLYDDLDMSIVGLCEDLRETLIQQLRDMVDEQFESAKDLSEEGS